MKDFGHKNYLSVLFLSSLLLVMSIPLAFAQEESVDETGLTLEAEFNEIDINQDTFLSEDEFMHFYSDFSDEEIQIEFDALDTNGDKLISFAEYSVESEDESEDEFEGEIGNKGFGVGCFVRCLS